MRKKHYLLLLPAFLFFYSPVLIAQTDSAYLDLGRTKMQKDFTQSVTVKGTELEKMPFTSLSDALKAWFNGAYTNASSLLFVVDGNLVHDVNAWSIHDIEEATLLQNAAGLTNGAAGFKQLVLVKTKTQQPGKQGFTVAGQTFLVNRDYRNTPIPTKSETNFYHQLHLSAYQNFKTIQVGLSAGYLRDVSPYGESENVHLNVKTPRNLDRIRVNGWLSAQLGRFNTLTVRMGYTPEIGDEEVSNLTFGGTETRTKYEAKIRALYPSVRLQSTITSELSNDFNAAYLDGKSDEESMYFLPPGGSLDWQAAHQEYTIRSWLIRDHISYHKKLGAWVVEPAVNFQFRHINETSGVLLASFDNNMPISVTAASRSRKGTLLLLTPSVSISTGNQFALQGGVLTNISKSAGNNNSQRVFPFASVMLDLLKLGRPQNATSLKLVGSYAEGGDFGEQTFRLKDIGNMEFSIAPPTGFYLSPVGSNPFIVNPNYSPINKVLQAGASFSLPANKVELSYQFNNRTFWDYVQVFFPTPSGTVAGWSAAKFRTTYHRVGLTANVVATNTVKWFSGINVTTGKIKLLDPATLSTNPGNNDLLRSQHPLTGGWVNRLQVKKLSFGASLLYLLNEERGFGPGGTPKENSFLLQNIYVGYRLSMPKNRQIELYADCRNPVFNKQSNLSDRRKFYGIGFRAQL